MSFETCIDTARAGGDISREAAERLKNEYEQFRRRAENGGKASADAQAKADLLDYLKADSAHKRRKAKLAIAAQSRIKAELFSHKNAAGKRDIAEAAIFKLEHFGTAQFSSVEGSRKAIIGMAHARMENFLHHFRRGAVGGDLSRHNAADMKNVVREAFGEDTGDMSAKGLAKSWTDTAEWLRKRFNAAGGAVGKLDNWGLPQHHDARALIKVGKEPWKQTIRPMLDTSKMTNPLTGKTLSARELDRLLDEIFDTITTDGWIKRDPRRQAQGRGALANQRADHRVLTFRDAQTWLEYQNAFGGGDPFSAMMGHINMLARDIAAMEELGPNPDGMIQWMKQAVEREGALKAAGKEAAIAANPNRAADRASSTNKRIDDVWGSIRGALETPVNSRWGNGMSAARSLITASVLGSAAISSISDIGTQMITRRFAGLGASGVFSDAFKAMTPTGRREAVASGLILDNAMHVFHAQARYVGTLNGPQWASFLADRVLTFSGLTPWTQAGRHAFGMAFQNALGERLGKSFDKLDAPIRNTLERHGIRRSDWDLMRKAKAHEPQPGAKFLRPQEIADKGGERLAERYLAMIMAETEFAIPSGSHRSRTALLNENRPGTFIGEVLRSFSQFKSFGAVFMILHGARVARAAIGGHAAGGVMSGVTAAAPYAGALLISTTLFGALALQLKQTAAGREPRDPTDADFWGAALLQGGGLGIYGDFLFSNINRYGGGFSTTLAGPVVQRANDIWNLTAGNAVQLASGEKTHFGRELVKFLRGNTPGSNIWYMRLAWERLLFDQMQHVVDPEANKAFKRQQQFWKREFDQEYWWKPGQAMPG